MALNDRARLGSVLSFDALERIALAPERAAALGAGGLHAVRLHVGAATLLVRFSSPAAARAFAARYRDAPSESVADYTAFAIEDGAGTYFWSSSAGRAWRWNGDPLTPETTAFFADNVALYEFLCGSEYLGFHAAVVADRAIAAALIGETTAGKTTTAIACVRRGLRLYSDERCILEDGVVVPFLRRLTLRPGGRAALLADDVGDGFGLAEKLRAWSALPDVSTLASSLLPGREGGAPLPLGAVFVIDGRAATPALAGVRASDVMPALLASMASRERDLDRLARLLRELHGTRIYRLRLGTPDATARLICAEMSAVRLALR